jgi:hypothetical protein
MDMRTTLLIALTLTVSAAAAQNPAVFSNQSPKPPAQPGQERHFLRAPEVLPGTLPEMRDVAYWVQQMKEPDQVILPLNRIQQLNNAYTERVKHPDRLDTTARKLIDAKLEAYPGLFFSKPDPISQSPADRLAAVKAMIAAEVGYMRHTEYGNILGIQYAPAELDRLEAEMSASTVSSDPAPLSGVAVEAVPLRIVPLISAEYVGQPDKNRTRWDVWNLDIVPIGGPVQILHVSRSGGFLFILSDNGYGWVPAEKIALGHLSGSKDFMVCTGDKVPFFSGPDCRLASGWIRMGDRLPSGKQPNEVLVPIRLANGSLSLQSAWLRPDADVHKDYLPYTRRNVVTLSFKLLDNIYDWTGAWLGRNHATALRDIFACFGFRLPSCGEQISVFTEHPKQLSSKETQEYQYQAIIKNDPFTTIQICSSGHSQLHLGSYQGVPVAYDTHGYNYADTSGHMLDIRRSCVETINYVSYFLKQDVVFIELK